MPILYDARGNEIVGSFPDQVVNGAITDARAQTVSLGALNAEAFCDLAGQAVVLIDLRAAAFTGTVVFEGTVDGTTYYSLAGLNQQLQNYVGSVVGAGAVAPGPIYLNASGFKRIKVRVSAFTSGSITVAMRGSRADYAITTLPIPSILCVTGTAAINTGVTITLPAVAGCFHYITFMQIVKFYGLLGVAAGAPVVVTTTNLPGSPAFSFDQSAAGQGQAIVQTIQPTTPIKSSVVNTATTIVAPVQLQTIWRATVWYYLGA